MLAYLNSLVRHSSQQVQIHPAMTAIRIIISMPHATPSPTAWWRYDRHCCSQMYLPMVNKVLVLKRPAELYSEIDCVPSWYCAQVVPLSHFLLSRMAYLPFFPRLSVSSHDTSVWWKLLDNSGDLCYVVTEKLTKKVDSSNGCLIEWLYVCYLKLKACVIALVHQPCTHIHSISLYLSSGTSIQY